MDYSTLEGAFPIQHIRALMQDGHIIDGQDDRVQPSSIDLTLSDEIYRMRGTFLPRPGEQIRDILKTETLFPTSLDQPLELNGIYLIRLNEKLDLPSGVYGATNNKSSSGRINLQSRLIVDGIPCFDTIPPGFKGDLWLEIIPKSFPVKLSAGEAINQMCFFKGEVRLSEEAYKKSCEEYGFLRDLDGNQLACSTDWSKGLTMGIDLSGGDIVGYKCTPSSTHVLDYSRRDHDPLDFFEPIYKPKDGQFVMKRDEFYIFVTKECILVPHEFAAEMSAYDVSKGEFRSHYAGFFDPGWGYGPDGSSLGRQAVLEVFTHDHDFILRDGQPICQMIFQNLTEPVEISYGDESLMNNYFKQTGPRLSKHFKTE